MSYKQFGGITGDLDDPAVRRCYGPDSFDDPGFTEALERCARILLGSLELKEVEP